MYKPIRNDINRYIYINKIENTNFFFTFITYFNLFLQLLVICLSAHLYYYLSNDICIHI